MDAPQSASLNGYSVSNPPMQKKPKVLIIGALPPPAIGPYLAMQRFVNSPALQDACEVIFLDTSDRRGPQSMGKFDLVNLWLGIVQGLSCCWRLLTRRPDVVYLGISQGTWGYLRDLTFIIPALLMKRALVIHLRGSEFRTFYDEMNGLLKSVTRSVFARAARVILLGNNLRHIFEGLVDPSRITVVPNGIDASQFYKGPAVSDPKLRGKRVLFLASLKRRKGIFQLLEAWPKVLEKHPEAQLTVAGQWRSEAEKGEGETILRKAGVADKVRFVGEVAGDEKSRIFSENDIFVFTPVEPEGLPWVILEAMSSSLPVITSDQGAIVEVVKDQETGFIIEPTPEAVASAICQLLGSPEKAAGMGVAGRRRVEEQFSEAAYLTKLVRVFREEGVSPKITERLSSAA